MIYGAMHLMRIIIANRDKDTSEAFAWQFRDLPTVETLLCSFEEIESYDCIATAGNSFGLMDAGIDLAIVRRFGRPLMERIQERILCDYLGEQPVGTSMIVPTHNDDHPFVAHTPTMRTPMNVSQCDNVYLATWATFLACRQHNETEPEKPIRKLVLPAFATGTGGVDAIEASLQMKIACEHFLSPPEFINPSMAQARQERIYYGGRMGHREPRRVNSH